MKDFTFKGGQDFLTYGETCAIARKFDIIPIEDLPENRKAQMQKIITRCLKHYTPEPGELVLIGVYLYDENKQAEDLQLTYGNTQQVTDEKAIIGLSESLLSQNMPVFHDVVFLHETGHLAEMNHGEDFQNRFNEIEYDYYFYNNIRADGGKMPKPDRKGWKM